MFKSFSTYSVDLRFIKYRRGRGYGDQGGSLWGPDC